MAFNGLKVIHARLDNRIKYILDPKKTNNGLYTGGVNTMPPAAYADMQATKAHFGKTDGRLGYHLIQSFAPGEITPLEAMQVGREFINRYLHGHYEVVYAVHTDHDHVHLHFIWNSVSFIDGRKYHAPPGTYLDEMRRISDSICRERGFSVIQKGEKMNGQPYAAWKAERTGQSTLRDQIRNDMDIAIRASATWNGFKREMERMGYTFKVNYKHLAVKAPGHPRYVRLKSLGEKYMPDAITQRIMRLQSWERPPKVKLVNKKRVLYRGSFTMHKVTWKSIRAQYYYFLSLFRKMEKKLEQKQQYKSDILQLKREAEERHILYERFQYLNANKIDTRDQLQAHTEKVQERIPPVIQNREVLYAKRRRAKTLEEAASISKEIAELNKLLKTYRKEEKLCKDIPGDLKHIRKVIQQVREPKKVEKVRNREQERGR